MFSTHRMEQVEQICENIVLINKGTSVLQGTVKEVQEQFKEHLFQLDYEGVLPGDIEQHIELEREGENRIVVKLRDDEHANNFLKYLLSHGTTIKAFNEILPTLNEIFIKIVGGASDE